MILQNLLVNGITKYKEVIFYSVVTAILITPSSLFSKISYAFSMFLRAKRWVISGVVSILPCSMSERISSLPHLGCQLSRASACPSAQTFRVLCMYKLSYQFTFFKAFNVTRVAPITPRPSARSTNGVMAKVVADAIYPYAN